MRYLIFILLLLTGCSRSPHFKAPDGEAGGCGGLFYRYDQAQLSLLKLDLSRWLQQNSPNPLELNVEKDQVDGEMRVFASSAPGYFCHDQAAKPQPKAIWKLLSGKIIIRNPSDCSTDEACNASVTLENGQFGFEVDGKQLEFSVDSINIARTARKPG